MQARALPRAFSSALFIQSFSRKLSSAEGACHRLSLAACSFGPLSALVPKISGAITETFHGVACVLIVATDFLTHLAAYIAGVVSLGLWMLISTPDSNDRWR